MPGIYGSMKAPMFINDVVLGKGSVDFIHLGDSNTGFMDGGEVVAGYVDGFAYGMELQRPNSMFATPLYHMNAAGGSAFGYKTVQGMITDLNGANVANSGALNQGFSGTPANYPYEINQARLAFGSGLKIWGNVNVTGVECLWRDSALTADSQRWANFSAGIYIDSDCPIGLSNELKLRIVGAKMPTATSTLKITAKDNGAPDTVYLNSVAMSFQGTASEDPIVHRSLTIPAASRSVNLAVYTAGGGVGVTNGWGNPIALGLMSISTAKKGWASNCLSSYGGGTLNDILGDVVSAPTNFLVTYFKEIILRQTLSSGLPYARAIVTINAGQNGNEFNANNYWSKISGPGIAKIKACWILAGGRAEDLAFIFMTSHQIQSTDGDRDALRSDSDWAATAAASYANVTSVNLASIVSWAEMTANSNQAFNAGVLGDPHLSEFGFNLIGQKVISALRNEYLVASSVNTVNPTTTYASYAPDFRGETQQLYVTAVLAASGTVTLPKIESFPASFLVTCQADTAGNSRHGIITAHSASLVTAFGTNVSTSAAAQTIVPTISSGTITLTASSTFGGGTNPVYVTRIG